MNTALLTHRYRWLAYLGRIELALADLDRLRKFRNETLTVEEVGLLDKLSNAAVFFEEWKLVGTAFSDLHQQNPEDSWTGFRAAIIHAYLDHSQEHREICEAMIQKFGTTTDASLACRIAKICLLLKESSRQVRGYQPACRYRSRIAEYGVESFLGSTDESLG